MPVTLPDDAPDPQVWVGTFKVTLEDGEHSTVLVGWDSLGMYASDAEFDERQEAETTARERLIRSQFTDQGVIVRSIELQRVGKFKLSR